MGGKILESTGAGRTPPARAAHAEHRCLGMFEHAPVGLYRTTPDGVILDASPGLADILGYASPEDVKARPASALYADPEARASVLEDVDRQGTVLGLEARLRRADGQLIWARLSTSAVRGSDGSVLWYEGVIEDVTERKRAEEALRESEERFLQSQKMEAVGKLAGGIAHDLNNLLTVMTGYSELLLARVPEGDAARREVVEIARAGERAAALTKQLLAFSRRQVLQPRVLDLNAVVAVMDSMLRRVIGEDVELRTLLAADLGSVLADQGQVEQVLMNLAVNARDAMPKGGMLTIETGNVHLDEMYAGKRAVVTPGRYVMLAVTDSGCGMPPEIQERVFEPFFTTKEVGKGTGLGLSTVYGIVKQSDGYVWVYSEPGHGTTFKVYLPLQTDAQRPVERPVLEQAPPPGAETILLVEDEDVVRELVREVLDMNGYTVLESRNGPEALALAAAHAGRIHLMLTDLVMPRMSGRELAEKLGPQRPDMRVLYMSGYTDDTVLHHGIVDPGVSFLQKPFRAEALARKVREILDQPRLEAPPA
jgi:PAS domain S-box-containing protein